MWPAGGAVSGAMTRAATQVAPPTAQKTGHWEKVGEAAGGAADQEIQAGMANADVTQSYDRLRREQDMRATAAGRNPNDPASIALQGSLGLSEAATRGGAMTTARRTAKDIGYAKRYELAGLGRNIPSQVSASMGSSAGINANLGANAYARDRTNQMDRAYGLAPVANAVGKAASQWFGGTNNVAANQLSSGWTPEQTIAYDSGSGVSGSQPWLGLKDGGKVGRKRRPMSMPMRGYAGGGRVIDGEATRYVENGLAAPGGTVPGPEGAPPDSVDAKVTPGEVVLNPDAVEVIGEDILHAANKIGLMKRYDRDNGRNFAAGL